MPIDKRKITICAYAKQREFLDAVLAEKPRYTRIGIGGSRGGGKSHATSLAHVLAAVKYPGIRTLILRMGTEDVIHNYRDQITEILNELRLDKAFKYLEAKNYFRGLNGSMIRLGFIREEKDYGKYLGHQYGLISLTEASEHVRKKWTDMATSNRAGKSGYVPRMTLDTNPGGVGQEWIVEMFQNPRTRQRNHLWIPAYIWDCPSTIIENPNYIRESLLDLPEWQQKQWLWGRFDALAGRYFTINPDRLYRRTVPFDRIPEIDEISVPKWATWWAGVDYGDAKPFAVTYFAKWKDVLTNREHIHTAAEIYSANLDLDVQAEYVCSKEQELRDLRILHNSVVYYADPSVAAEKPSEREEQNRSIVQVWRKHGFYPRQARTRNRIVGWKLMKLLMRLGVWTTDLESCPALAHELNTLQVDGAPGPPRSEDTMQGTNILDHAADSARYALVSIYPQGYTESPEVDPLTGRVPETWEDEIRRMERVG